MDWIRSAFQDRSETKSYDETNGLIFNDIPLPEEVILQILGSADIKTILKCKLVCKKWNELIKSNHFWRNKLHRFNKKTKNKLPWYVYYCYTRGDIFDINFLKNGNGQQKLDYWNIHESRGNKWAIEVIPAGADLLPENLPEFNGHLSCFATSYMACSKSQRINFKNNKLIKKILNEFQPTIYVSEWFAGRFDCGCTYKLCVKLFNSKNEQIFKKEEMRSIVQWAGTQWSKVEIKCENYGKDVSVIEFYHEGCDTQFWAGHYGSKMAGGVVKLLFDSL